MDPLLLVYQVCVSQYTAALYNAPRYIIYILSESSTCSSGTAAVQQLCQTPRRCIITTFICPMTPVLDSPLPTTPPLQNQSYAKSNTTATKYIQLGDTFTTISDPWRDDIPLYDQPQRRELQTPDPSIFDQTITASILDNSQVTGTRLEPVSKDVLSEFDPLVASAEEQAAHDAWETAESHPPPRSSSLSPYSAPVKDGQNPSPGSRTRTLESGTCSSTPLPVSPTPSSSFPSLAVLARTFSIPSFSPKTRSLSLDVAKPIASPSTLSFVVQQDQRAEFSEDERSPVLSTANSLARSDVSTVRDSRDGGGNGSKSAEGQFDFQKFLDQMKTRSADPVSKYLRSCVSFFFLSLVLLIFRLDS